MLYSKYFKNEITGTCFNLKIYNIPLELASIRPFYHTNTYKLLKFMSFQGNAKGQVFQKQAWDPLFLFFIIIAYHNTNMYAKS